MSWERVTHSQIIQVFTGKQIDRRNWTTACPQGRERQELQTAAAAAASTQACGCRAGRAAAKVGKKELPVKTAASFDTAAAHSKDNQPAGQNNGSHSSAEGQESGWD